MLHLFLLACVDAPSAPTAPPEPTPASSLEATPAVSETVELPEATALRAAGLCSEHESVAFVGTVVLDDGRTLIEATCEMFAYQGRYSYAWADGVKLVLDQDGNPFGLLGNPVWDAQTGTLSWLEKTRGPGDCGNWYQYVIEGERLVRKEHRSRECDAFGAVPDPSNWALVTPNANGR